MFFETIVILMPSSLSFSLNASLDDGTELDLGEANVVVLVALDVAGDGLELVLGEVLDQALGEHGDAVGAAVREALDDGAGEDVDDLVERDGLSAELLGNDRERRARGLADAEREVAGLSAHRDDEVPARRGLRVGQQILHDAGADVARRLVAEGRDALGQVEIVVDRLRDVDDAERALRVLGELDAPRTPCRRRRW